MMSFDIHWNTIIGELQLLLLFLGKSLSSIPMEVREACSAPCGEWLLSAFIYHIKSQVSRSPVVGFVNNIPLSEK